MDDETLSLALFAEPGMISHLTFYPKGSNFCLSHLNRLIVIVENLSQNSAVYGEGIALFNSLPPPHMQGSSPEPRVLRMKEFCPQTASSDYFRGIKEKDLLWNGIEIFLNVQN